MDDVDDNTIEAAEAALASAEEDVIGDFGEEGLEAGFADIVAAVAIQFPPDVAVELCRMKLGWVPADVRRVHNLPDNADEEWML
jgi:hypothetical protein